MEEPEKQVCSCTLKLDYRKYISFFTIESVKKVFFASLFCVCEIDLFLYWGKGGVIYDTGKGT